MSSIFEKVRELELSNSEETSILEKLTETAYSRK